MPRTIPRYRKHASGQAVVSIDGKDIYLGKYETPDSRQRYTELVTAYLERKPTLDGPTRSRLTIAKAIDRFWFGHAAKVEKRERHHYQRALQPLSRLYGSKPIADLGPVWFQAVRRAYVELGWSRQHCNAQADRLKRFLRWLVSNELYDVSKLATIREVPRLKPGEAMESAAVVPVSWSTVKATLKALPVPVRGIILFMWWTGARPGEACRIAANEIDRSGKLKIPGGDVLAIPSVWSYRPTKHKGVSAGRPRIILLGPKAQAVIGKAFVDFRFDPRTVATNPRASEHYSPHSLITAVKRACKKLGLSPWHPHMLRHAAASRFRAFGGKEIAATLLGHAGLTVTDRYAIEDWKRAAHAAAKCG